MKKILAILLSVIMTFGCMSFAVSAEETEPLCPAAGDMDGDGRVTTGDARLALRYAIDLENEETLAECGGSKAVARADIHEKEGVTTADARSILRIAIELDPQPDHKAVTVISDPKWTVKGASCEQCAYCGQVLDEPAESPSKLDTVAAEVNTFASEKGFGGLISLNSEKGGAELTLDLNVDAIWNGLTVADGTFDGMLTNLGGYVNKTFSDAVITFDGETVYNGKLLNTPVKQAIFSVFNGFFYKIATAENGVYGTYALTVDGEDVALTVKMTGREENVAKVRSFAQTIANHVWADTTGADLVIGISMPDELMNVVNEKGGLDKVNASTVGACLTALQAVSLENVIGSQQSAVNKLCSIICGMDAFVNKVAGKVLKATVTVGDAEVDLLSGAAFTPATADYYGLLDAAVDMLSNEFKSLPVGAFLFEDGTYRLALNVTVDVSGADVMANGVISETIYIVIEA